MSFVLPRRRRRRISLIPLQTPHPIPREIQTSQLLLPGCLRCYRRRYQILSHRRASSRLVPLRHIL